MTIKKKVINGVKWTTLSSILLAVFAVLKLSILARYLEKTDFGLVAIITVFMSFMELFNDMGISSAILHKQEMTKKEYSSLYWFNLIVSVVLYFIVFGLSFVVAYFYEIEALTYLIPLMGLSILMNGIGRQFKVIEQKKLNFKFTSLVEIIGALISFILAVFLAINDFGVYTLIYSLLMQILITNLIFISYGIKNNGLLLHYKFSETIPFLKIGIYQVGGQITNFFNRDLDSLLIAKFFSAEILGGYSLAKQLVFRPAQLINPILVKVATPALALFQSNKEMLKKNYLKLINVVSSINIPIYLIIMIFSPWIVELMYGKGFQEINIIVRILSINMIFRAIGNPVGSLVVATGRTDLDFKWNLLTLFITPLFIFIGANMGIVEVTMLLSLAMILLFYPSWIFLVKKMTGATFKEYLNACFVLNYGFLNKNKR